MLILCRHDLSETDRETLLQAARDRGFLPQRLGPHRISLFGPGSTNGLETLDGVERIIPDPEHAALAGRAGEESAIDVVEVGDVSIGRDFTVIAGPCAVESRNGMIALAEAARDAGADMMRGGAYKPRTSPYSFRGLGREGLSILAEARERTGLPVVTEVLDTRDVAIVADHVDLVQIGTRNMMNYPLLAEAGRCGRPILLKRGMGAMLAEWLWAAEYLLVEGAPGVVLCERGIRTFENELRNTLDVSAIPAMRERTSLPIVVDPSHGTGRSSLVPPMARAAAAAGADGVMMEIHGNPDHALSDGEQATSPERLAGLVSQMRRIASIAREEGTS